MPSLSETLARLAASQPRHGAMPGTACDRLTDIVEFGTDPGNLRARCYVPDTLTAGAPLVVVLHGCTQTAAGYDLGSGWSTLAERHGFALLYPEQRQVNNANRCFNWFVGEDIARDKGEVASVRQMIARMVAAHGIDPARVFVTGLSAGGAMAMALLATYPEVFAGGAVIAGLPYGTARSVGEALQRMRGSGLPGGTALAERICGAAPAPARWPTLSVWHGSADQTVAPANMDAIVAGWAGVQGLALAEYATEQVDGQERRRWRDATGAVRIEAYTVAGLGHGTPIDPATGVGAAMPFMLPCRISSTDHMAATWGIADAKRTATASSPEPRQPARAVLPTGVGKVIEDALRASGLVR